MIILGVLASIFHFSVSFHESPLTCKRLILLSGKCSLKKSPIASMIAIYCLFHDPETIFGYGPLNLGKIFTLPFKEKDKPSNFSIRYRFNPTENHHIAKTY